MRMLLLALVLLAPSLHAAESLSREEAAAEIARVHAELVESSRKERLAELEAKSITIGDKTMRWLEKRLAMKLSRG